MNNFNGFIEKNVVPTMGKIENNIVLKSITHGMMATMPLSLGTSIVAIIANFPNKIWTTWLAETGLAEHAAAVISGSTTIIALYLAFIIGFYHAKARNADGMTAGVLSLAAFLILMPQTIVATDGTVVDGYARTYLGASGVFVSIISGILISGIYVFLKKKNLSLKLPDSVPEMVNQSLSPTFIAMIIFIIIFAVRVLFGFTSYGNAFDAINQIIGAPVMKFGATPTALITLYALVNLFWTFGIHPSALTSFYTPVLLAVITGNIEAFQSNQALPYLSMIVIYQFIMLGGTGSTLGLVINMLLFGKSNQFKMLGKLTIIPNLFNINEPVIFGTPIVYNPVFMLPMTLVPVVNGIIGLLLTKAGWFAAYNPTIKVPWTMPAPIIQFLQTGWLAALAAFIVIIVDALLYFPFFKIADKIALQNENENKETVQ
ncbi:PTS sugar transporter subunit IIC [Enterococcus sp. LJL99]